MPNSSARCAQLPRAVDKVPFYEALRKYRDYLAGAIPHLDEADVVFSEVKLRSFNELSPEKKLQQQQQRNHLMASDPAGMNSEFKGASNHKIHTIFLDTA